MIAVVGHTDLTAWTLAQVEDELRGRFALFAEAGRTGLVRVQQGLPVAVGRAAKRAGLALVTVLPAKDRLPALLPGPDRRAAGELLMLSREVRLEGYDPHDRDACVRADERLLTTCARVFAVWDGSGSDSRDWTGHLVTYARGLGLPVDVLWPSGAARMPGES
jgi:hypothetical protein